jgi:periplasmic protein TonB
VKLRKPGTLQIALSASIAVHAGLLAIRLVDPAAFNRVFEDTPLEVVLVNARSTEKPTKARALAQANLNGGGNADNGRATSPLPPAEVTDSGEAQEQIAAATRVQNLQDQQTLLLAQVRQQLSSLPPPDPKNTANREEQVQREAKRKQLVKLLAEIERRINSENARPRKRYISPATREVAYAAYYDNLRHIIEDRGTENFPTANGQKLYGELTMLVTVNFDGRILATEVVESSGNPVLDRRAAAITRSAGPFGHFNAEMRRQADQILVVSRFKFTRDETLQAKVSAGP